MKSVKWLTPILLLVLVFSPVANAQVTQGEVRTTDTDVDNNRFDPGPYAVFTANYGRNYEGDDGLNGMSLIGRFGYDINENVALEAETGWLFLNAENDNLDAGTIHVIPLIGNIVGKYPVSENLVPYASGGFGVFFFGFNESDTLENAGADVDFDNASVGFKVALGADYWLNDDWAINFETGYYFIVDPDATASIGGTRFTGEGDLDTWYIGGGLKYKF